MNGILSQKGFKIFHLNIRSLVPKLDQLKILLEYNDVDIFSISETWLHEGISSNILSIPGYVFVRLDREVVGHEHQVKRGGGLGVYYNPNLSCDKDVFSDRNVSSKDLELQVLQFTRKNARKIVLFNVYRPPNGLTDVALDHIDNAIQGIPNLARKDIVIMGDFNVDILDSRHRDTKSLKYFASENGLSQLIDSPTRFTTTSRKAIDLIFTNMDYIVQSGTIDFFASDHQPIFLIKKKPKINYPKSKFSGRTYRNYNKNSMQERLEEIIDRNRINNENDPSVCWNYLLTDITKLADEITPKKEYKIRTNKPPWLTNELLNSQKDRDYFYRKAKRSKLQEDWLLARAHRNTVNIAIRNAKSNYIKDELTRNKSNPKKFWRTIHTDILPNNKSQLLNLINPTTNLPYKQEQIPTVINEFFAEIGPRLAENLPDVDMEYLNDAINNDETPLKLGNKDIAMTESYRYLGTAIDRKLNCHAQYNSIIKKLSVKKISFSKIRYLLNTESAVSLYKACIQPLFDYNDFYYLFLSQRLCKKLQSMQYRFLRIVFIGDNYSRVEMLQRVGIENLDIRRKVHLAGLMYKRSCDPEYIDEGHLPTRQFDKKVLKVPDVVLTKTFKSPMYMGSTIWNALPRDIQDAKSYKTFKYLYKALLL